MIKSIRGTRDLLPPDTALWNFVEAAARDVFRAYNFQEIRTPIVEDLQLFQRSVGEETDIVTWVMVGQVKNGSSGIDDVFFYPCHIWVDDGMALINGRELYGYPKYPCDYTMPQDGQPATRFTLAAKGFHPFSPETQLAMSWPETRMMNRSNAAMPTR